MGGHFLWRYFLEQWAYVRVEFRERVFIGRRRLLDPYLKLDLRPRSLRLKRFDLVCEPMRDGLLKFLEMAQRLPLGLYLPHKRSLLTNS